MRGKQPETVNQTVSILNMPDCFLFYFRLNIWESDIFKAVLN
nr:MAG TPA: hypothetical protein [Caudoviricetes sp.]